MIITHFPNTLGGVSFEKLVNYLGEGKPNFFDAQFFLPPTPQPFLATTKGDSPLETPNLCFSFYFLFLLLVVISFGFLAIYTNEYLLLLNDVDRKRIFSFLLKSFRRKIGFFFTNTTNTQSLRTQSTVAASFSHLAMTDKSFYRILQFLQNPFFFHDGTGSFKKSLHNTLSML